ncbi:hypothetical protein BLNAU_18808 [Blattamonas nauphoetae]|uniref:Uncharacterized protein n=1 Tax=Blattamonas nauphoetae TaxID=2049346 RepID=A0ABQ9X5V6_9EUKA|nr:hypothetical protein BLNAU_18808 [Blattamonas nauphoetae]
MMFGILIFLLPFITSSSPEVPHAVYVDLRKEIASFRENQNGTSNEDAIRLGNTIYHTESLVFTSACMNLVGTYGTTLVHSSSLSLNANTQNGDSWKTTGHKMGMGSILLLQNSSMGLEGIWMKMNENTKSSPSPHRLSYSSGQTHHLSTLVGSELSLTSCKLTVSSESPGFLIGSDSWFGEESSISLRRCQIFGMNGNIRPLTKILSSGLSSSVAISVSSLSLDSFGIVSGNSLLFDVCSSKSGDVRNCEVFSSLTSSSFRNLTSTRNGGLQMPCRLSQQSHGLTITETVGALQGTILQDHNFGGSHLCTNTTFSACRSSYPTIPDFTTAPGFSRFLVELHKLKLSSYDFVDQTVHRHTFWSPISSYPPPPEQYIFPTPFTPITFTDCTFTDLKDETQDSSLGGGALHFYTSSPLLVKNCTFTNCVTTYGNGGAIIVQDDYTHNPQQIRVESTTFKHCSSLSGDGGGICVRPEVTLDLVSSNFENCSAVTGKGGAVCAQNCAVSFSTFKDNKAQTSGGLACSSGLTINFCHFEGNEATREPDFTEDQSEHLFPLFGISFSDAHWEAQSDLLFVRSGGTDTAPCTFDQPCSLLSTTVSLAPVDGSVEVQVGTGSFGSATVSSTQKLTLNGLFTETDIQETPKTTSFSVEVKDDSSLSIDTFTLFPLPGKPLVFIPSGASGVQINMTHLRLSGSGITAVSFDFQAGTVTLTKSCFKSLSDIQCSLISVAGTAELSISGCVFIDIEIEASVINVNGGSLSVTSPTSFRRITRTEGTGSAAIDAQNPQSLTIHASFFHCHSIAGEAGALHIDSSEVQFDGELKVFMIGNKGQNGQTAHDIFFSGVTQEELLTSSFSSSSDQPQIMSDTNLEIQLQRIKNITVVDDMVADITTSGEHTIPAHSLESTDLSVLMDQSSFNLTLSTSAQCVLTFSPLHIQSGTVSIHTWEDKIKPIVTQTSKIDEPLFKITTQNGDDTDLTINSFRILLNTQLTAPMIRVDPQSYFKLEKSIVSSDGGVSHRPFARSEGCIAIEAVLFINLQFDGCSCIETTGGNMSFNGGYDFSIAGIYSLSTTVDGAFLNAVSANVKVQNAIIVDCHARNGGAIFTKDCLQIDFTSYFIDCSAEERGGGFCSEHSGSISQKADFLSNSDLANCHAKLGGGFFLEIAPLMDVMIGSNQDIAYFGQELSLCLFEGCSAEKGAGGYLDGEVGPSAESFISSHNSINDVLCKGSEFFITQSLAESILRKGDLQSSFFLSYCSLSSRSESDDGPYKHVEVEGYPQHSFNFEPPNIGVLSSSTLESSPCIGEYFSIFCSSLSHIIDRFHTQTDNGRFLQVPIKLKDTLFIFETARVTKQSIKLILTDEGYPPPERTAIAFGNNHKSDTTVFIVDTSGSVELSELKVDWKVNLALCQLIDRTASMSILECEIKIASALSFPLITCQAGTLVISDSSYSSTTSDTFNHSLVLSRLSTSFASNSAQSEMNFTGFGSGPHLTHPQKTSPLF